MSDRFEVQVTSEVGRLTGVVMHDPGQEVANMTPETAERALYSDILNLEVARREYAQLRGVLARRAEIFQVRGLLQDILGNDRVRSGLVRRICEAEGVPQVADGLLEQEPAELARLLIEGVPMVKDNLTRFLSADRYSLPPLHNFFFTRDAAVTFGDSVLVSCMASGVRGREARIMEAIFDFHPRLGTPTMNPARLGGSAPGLTIEGGDVLVAAPDVLVVGLGARTTSAAIDFLIERFRERGVRQHILVQELPRTPESFIHLDMVFTLLDREPVPGLRAGGPADPPLRHGAHPRRGGPGGRDQRGGQPAVGAGASWAWTWSRCTAGAATTAGSRSASSGTAGPTSSPSGRGR